MHLYFLRHGIAQEREFGLSDFDRKLTPEGVAEMQEVARGIAALNLKLDAILSSPLVRARETADLAAQAVSLPVRIEERIASGHAFRDLRDALADRSEEDAVLLVGHEPDFSTNVGTLIGGGYVRMKKASLAAVEARRVAPGGGYLRWLLEARQLARLG